MSTAYELAEKEIGTVEWKDGHNPRVVAYFKDAGHPGVTDDETAWCAAFVGAMLARAGGKGTGQLTARSYLGWGEEVARADAKPGDLVVLKRGNSSWQGHVGFFVRDHGSTITILGGNQANAVNRRAYKVAGGQLLGIRRAKAVPKKAERSSPSQSSTVQATAVQVASGVGAGLTAVGALEGTAQIMVVVLLGVIILAAVYIMRERLKKWAAGVR
jgi:uncharacterized protein (TIGR02594 family)